MSATLIHFQIFNQFRCDRYGRWTYHCSDSKSLYQRNRRRKVIMIFECYDEKVMTTRKEALEESKKIRHNLIQ